MLAVALVAAIALQTPGQLRAMERLSRDRAFFDGHYASPRAAKLKVLEKLGTNNLGNPMREWYFPSGSAAFRVWIVTFPDDTGVLVHQVKRGKQAIVDWVLPLVPRPHQQPKPRGTLALTLWIIGWTPKGSMTRGQRGTLEAVQGLAGFAEGRGPYEAGDRMAWYVRPDGQLSDQLYYFHVEEAHVDIWQPAVTKEEAFAMGSVGGWSPMKGGISTSEPLSWETKPGVGKPSSVRW